MADLKVTDEMIEVFKLSHDPANELEQPDLRAGLTAVLHIVERDLKPPPGPCSASLTFVSTVATWCQLRHGHEGDHENGTTRWREAVAS